MRLILAHFDGVFGLRGQICFTPEIPLILYAPNIAGKTNVIAAIRMCFLGHKIFRRLRKDETILKPLKEGSVSCYFSQWDNIFRISYTFKRFGETVRRSCRLSSIPLKEIAEPQDKMRQWLEAQDWEEEAKSPREIKRRLEEIEVYPEIMDILLASSNIDGYLRAVEGEVCEIPEALSKQLTDIKSEANMNVKRIQKVRQGLQLLEESQKNYIRNQKESLKKIGVKPAKIKRLFAGKVAEKLEAYRRRTNERLARGIPEDKERAIAARNDLKPLRKKLRTAEEISESLKVAGKFNELSREASRYRKAKQSWTEISEGLKLFPKDVWSLDGYSVPSLRGFGLTVFKDPSDVKSLLRKIRRHCRQIKKAKGMASKYDIDSLSYLKRAVDEMNTALSRLKNPRELPEDAVPALLCLLPKRRRPIVSVSVDKYQPELAKVSTVTAVHVPKDMGAPVRRKIKQMIKEQEHQVKELRKSLQLIAGAEKEIDNVSRAIKSITEEKEKELSGQIREIEKKISGIQKEWNGKATVLYDHFGLGKMLFTFTEETYAKDLAGLRRKVKQCHRNLKSDINEILSSFPRLKTRLLKKVGMENFDTVADSLSRRVRRLEREREILSKIQKWLQKEAENVKKAWQNLRCCRILLKKVLPFSQTFYGLIFKLINLEEVVESLGTEMERNVETAYSSIFAEPTFRFTHVGKGLFTPKLEEQPITGPSGSQSAAVSFGILYTLAYQYKLPIIMDEAADRFDPTRLANFMELVRTVTMGTEEAASQICLAIYETRDIDPEELNALNTYECFRISNTEKRIRPYVAGS